MIDQHIVYHLEEFLKIESELSQAILKELPIESTNDYEKLILYLLLVLEQADKTKRTDKEIKSLHLHFTKKIDEKCIEVILEAMWRYEFLRSYKEDSFEESNKILHNLKEELDFEIKHLNFPEGATLRRNQIIFEKQRLNKIKRKYLEEFQSGKTFSPSVLINFSAKFKNGIIARLNQHPFFNLENDKFPSYVILNCSKSYDDLIKLDYDNNPILKLFKKLILFNCAHNLKYEKFNLDRLYKHNLGRRIDWLIIITFETAKNNFKSLTKQQDFIYNRFKITQENSYIMLESEINLLLKKNKKELKSSISHFPIELFFSKKTHFQSWETLVREIQVYQELMFLISLGFRNLYSLCLNNRIKDYILNSIFDHANCDYLKVSGLSIINIAEIDSAFLSKIKILLSDVLDRIIEDRFVDNIKECVADRDFKLVIDLYLLKNPIFLKSELLQELDLQDFSQIITWEETEVYKNETLIFLSYRDLGTKYTNFSENLLESTFNTQAFGFYHAFLFKNLYRKRLNLYREELWNRLNHSIRKKFFKMDELRDKLSKLDFKTSENENQIFFTDEIDDQVFSSNDSKETFEVEYSSGIRKLYGANEHFILKYENEDSFYILQLYEIKKILQDEFGILIISLNYIQDKINLFEKIIERERFQEEMLDLLSSLNLQTDSLPKVWKCLLLKKSKELTPTTLYSKLVSFFNEKKLDMVSFGHFEHVWISPSSEAIAPLKKKMFFYLCEYLNLPITYYKHLLKIRLTNKHITYESKRQMNRLLVCLFEDGCFDTGIKFEDIVYKNWDKYKSKMNIEDLGVDEADIISLVDIVKTDLNLQKVKAVR